MPRARIVGAASGRAAWFRGYLWRTERFDGRLVGVYLCGTKAAQSGRAAAPWRAASKDAMSRLVALLRENFVTTTLWAQWPKIAIQRCTNHKL
jgi:hypothetical protein